MFSLYHKPSYDCKHVIVAAAVKLYERLGMVSNTGPKRRGFYEDCQDT